MKNLFGISLVSLSFFFGAIPLKADPDYWEVIRDSSVDDYHYDFYKLDSTTGSRTFITDKTFDYYLKTGLFYVDPATNKFFINEYTQGASNSDPIRSAPIYSYDIDNSRWDTSGSISYSIMGDQMIDTSSAIEETENRLTNNINNLGSGVANATALSAALTALPQASKDSKFSCGIGTGTYSKSFALGIGCASKVNERVDVNFGGSYIGGGAKSYGNGSLENVAAKAGFIFKLGKINSPTLISKKEKKDLQLSNIELKEIVKSQNIQIAEQNNRIAMQNERLEKLESISLSLSKSIDLANIAK